MPRTKKRKQIGRCVHCLRLGPLTDDHVIPKSWYPDSTPLNLAKWTAPACRECNASLGQVEKRLLEVMGLCVDPESAASLGIAQRALRAVDPRAGKTRRDRLHRAKRLQSLMRTAIPRSKVDTRSVLPGFEAELTERTPGIGIRVSDFDRFIEKVVRGVIYATEGAYVEDTHAIELQRARGQGGEPFRKLLQRFGSTHHRGPGVEIALAKTEDGTAAYIVGIRLWGRDEWYATVTPRE